ncbi:hypothetical protein [Variovorax arabinosiphilus]|uniref:hypothetical protein n=1 Tax=Variovorax arabinosiphilus TaxID=3053498 RepID=UPI0025759972|nr:MULTISPECIES: hypothetical protein [unclassified Variovorax]MDM0119020.1 hypothetical protein [Variovorax sp. J2L1-78]MDM0129446.1 hypothetical protein [Variovorax sp. J2L1-63]MDM0232768.1 hypothetical protein [Variovorax sp. J2R1-6]
MLRKQLAALAVLALNSGVSQFVLEAVKSGADIAFKATVFIGPDGYRVADDAGKVKTFRDADDFLKQAGALGMLADETPFTMRGLALVAPKPFTGDIVKKNQGIVLAYAKRQEAAGERANKLRTELTLMEADPTVPQSLKDEKTAQKASVEELGAWLAAEILRINAILAA